MTESCRNSTYIADIIRAVTCQTHEVGFFADLSLLGDDSFAVPEDTAIEDKVLAWLTDGVETDQIGRALSNIGIDPCPVLLAELQRAQLQSGRFATIPRIDSPVRTVKQRGAGHFDIFTDNGIVAGDRVLLRLLPPPSTPQTALTNLLVLKRDATKEAALKVLKNQFPNLSNKEFFRLWPDAREAAGLARKAPPGRHPKGGHDLK